MLQMTLSLGLCVSSTAVEIVNLHRTLCHPGVAGFYCYIRMKNLIYSMEDVKNVVSFRVICCKVKTNTKYFNSRYELTL